MAGDGCRWIRLASGWCQTKKEEAIGRRAWLVCGPVQLAPSDIGHREEPAEGSATKLTGVTAPVASAQSTLRNLSERENPEWPVGYTYLDRFLDDNKVAQGGEIVFVATTIKDYEIIITRNLKRSF